MSPWTVRRTSLYGWYWLRRRPLIVPSWASYNWHGTIRMTRTGPRTARRRPITTCTACRNRMSRDSDRHLISCRAESSHGCASRASRGMQRRAERPTCDHRVRPLGVHQPPFDAATSQDCPLVRTIHVSESEYPRCRGNREMVSSGFGSPRAVCRQVLDADGLHLIRGDAIPGRRRGADIRRAFRTGRLPSPLAIPRSRSSPEYLPAVS